MKRKILSIQALRKRNKERRIHNEDDTHEDDKNEDDHDEDYNKEDNHDEDDHDEENDEDDSPIIILNNLGFSQFLQSHIGGNRTKLGARKTCMSRVVSFAEYAYYKV
jgi:hypothetical protein